MRSGKPARPLARGFTLIEMLAVMAIMATLLAISAPRYFDSVARAKESALKADLRVLRDAIDKFDADHDRYPDSLQQLVQEHYLRSVPPDPLTDSAATWTVAPPPEGSPGNVYDVHSGAAGSARDGTAYAQW